MVFYRNAAINTLHQDPVWDMVIIGGGASGLGVAVDASSRGYKVLLLEQYDFAKGTSSKSTKLVHGGVRYLAKGQLGLVTEALKERGLLAKNANHLFKRQAFVIPTYSIWQSIYYLAGLAMYALLSGKRSLGKSKYLSKDKVLEANPTLKSDKLSGGVMYYDGQFDDARLALNLAQTAARQGATVLNYCKAIGFETDHQKKINKVNILDSISGNTYKAKTKVVINATGIFTDKTLKLYNTAHKKTVVPSQGIHLMLDGSYLQGTTAIMIPKTTDGRVLFIIPWHNSVIAGTTDTPIKKPNIEPKPLREEVQFILDTINQYLAKKATVDDVRSVFSGLRPLAKPKDEEASTKEVSRGHKIIKDANMLSIVGGKWTTYRKMAEDVVDKVHKELLPAKKNCQTKDLPIHGHCTTKKPKFSWLDVYGADKLALLDLHDENPSYWEPLHPNHPFTLGQLYWAIKNEMAITIDDFLARRIRLLLLDAKAATEVAPKVAAVMAKELGHGADWEQQQLESFNAMAQKYLLLKAK